MRVLILSGYSHPSHHRKIELLADTPDAEILQLLQPGNGKASGEYPSADGQRCYRVKVVPVCSLGQPNDPHRTVHWPMQFELQAFHPDVIHCEHEQEGLLAAEVALARNLWLPRTPLILYSWQNILRPRRKLVRWVSDFTLRAAQHLICASTEGVEVVRQQGFGGGATVMPLFGLDTRYFYPRPTPHRWPRFAVGYVGRLVEEKGVETILRAAAQLPVEVVIVGSGPDRARLVSLAQQLDLGERCHFVGEVAYDQIATYLNAFDLLVLPSRTTQHWKEQYGRVLVEAMACKVAVAGSDSGAIPEVIGSTGRIFPEGQIEALVEVIRELSARPDALADLRERGYQQALSRFSVEQLAAQTLSIWRSLVKD
ncbi:MAG: glycosyltransferase [Anaerolineae bacterium]